MNRFEQAVCDCMNPTAKLLEQTANPLHRAMLLNFWRHVHLEGSGQFDKIVAADMMVDRPVYRITWGASPAVIEGKDGVLAFYNSVYHVSSRQAFIWPYDERGRLAGENLYEDKTSLSIEEVSPAEATTPARVREIHRDLLARLHKERGDRFWMLNTA